MQIRHFIITITSLLAAIIILVIANYNLLPMPFAQQGVPEADLDIASSGLEKTSNTITFASDLWPPYAGEPGTKEEGFITDVVREIYEPLGYNVVYLLKPWTRCIADVGSGKIDGLISGGHEEVPDYIFPKEKIGVSKPAFIALQKSSWKYEGIGSLKGIRLGVIQDYSYDEGPVYNYIKNNRSTDEVFRVKGNDALKRLIHGLIDGKADVIIETPEVFYYTVKKMGMDKSMFKKVGVTDFDGLLYVPFSPVNKNSRKYAGIFDSGVQKLRKSGRLQKLMEKYSIEDWEKNK